MSPRRVAKALPWDRWPWAVLYLVAVALEFLATWAKDVAVERIKGIAPAPPEPPS